MSHLARLQQQQPAASLQGVEKAPRARPLATRASNLPVLAKAVHPKVLRAGVPLKNEKREAPFEVYTDENGETEFNVVKQLERVQPRLPPTTLSFDETFDDEPCQSMGEGSEYFSVPDTLPYNLSCYDTPADMVSDMYQYMRSREQQFMVHLRWEKQPELKEPMRAVLIDWLHDVIAEYNMEPEVLHLTVSLLDRLLMQCSVSRPNIQLVGTAALMIASKYELIYPPELKDFVYVTDDSYTDKQILRMEHKILNILRFDVSVPTVEWFVSHLVNMVKPDQSTGHLAHYLGDLSLLSTSLNGTRPSVIAAACLALANLITGPAAWTTQLEEATGISLAEIDAPMRNLLAAFNGASGSELLSIYERYAEAGKDSVSLLPAPATLPPLC